MSRARAASAGRFAVLLAPGAGADRDAPALVAIDRAVSEAFAASATVERMDFPYRKAGRRAPDRAPVLLEAVRDEATALIDRSAIVPDRLVLGGRSMGGRMCSMVVAEGLEAAGLVLVSYPLHPPGKPERLRVEHFPSIRVPCLFVSGTRDAFGTPEELREHTRVIPGPVDHVWIEGGDHGLKRHDEAVAAAVQRWMTSVVS